MERRNCVDVINIILKEIPLIEDNFAIISQLNYNLNDALYKAPEENIQW